MDTLIAWRGMDGGTDRCSLGPRGSGPADGWRLSGAARFPGGGETAELRYDVLCDAGWQTESAHVRGRIAGRVIDLRIDRTGRGWTVNGTPQPAVTGAGDIDLYFTPATNLMPLRRLGASPGAAINPRAAWLCDLGGTLVPLDQAYTRGATPDTVFYTAAQTGFATDLTVHPSGFVTRYPGFWTGEVQDAV